MKLLFLLHCKPKFKRQLLAIFTLLVVSLVAVGCSNDGKTQLQGECFYGGEPIPLGTITFTPKADGYRAVQTIKEGKFDIPAKNGVQPGEYNVLVEGYEEAPVDDPDQVAKKLFPDYSTSIVVESGQPIVIDVPKN